MADYYPLLSRAVAGLPSSTSETRRAIYDRAGKALLGQLKAIQPPIPQSDIEREEKALQEAIARIEQEHAQASVHQSAAAAIEAALDALGSAQAASAAPAVVASPDNTGVPSVQIRPPSSPGQSPRSESGATSDEFDRPVRPGAHPAGSPARAPRAGTGAASQAGAKGKRPTMLYAILALVVIAVGGGIGFYAWKTRLTPEQIRQGRLAAAPKPAPASTPEGTPAAPAVSSAPKIENRADENKAPEAPAGTTPAATSSESAPAEPATPGETVQTPSPVPPSSAAEQGGIPIAQRSAVLITSPTKENPQNVQTYVGTVVWRTDTVSRGPGQPVSLAVRADVDIPEAKFSAVMTIEKNTDATFPASHTVNWRFQRAEDGPIPEIQRTDTLQMRDETSANVDPLIGVSARITPNIFIIALASGDAATKRNLELLEKKTWFDLPLQTTDGRIAKITIEKGSPGDKIMQEALARWAQ